MKQEDRWEYFFQKDFATFYSDSIFDLFLKEGKIYLATNLGLSILNLETRQFRTLGSIDNLWGSQVTALDGNEEVLWIGTAMGICVLTYKDDNIYRIDNELIYRKNILDLAVDGNFLWVGTDWGLYLHDIRLGDWTYVAGAPEMMGSAVNDIQAGEKEIWLAREVGLEMFDKDTGKWRGYNAVHIGNHHPLAINADDSLVWVGSDGGLYKYDRILKRWHGYTTNDGLPSNKIHQVEIKGDYLWLATDGGLCRFFWNAPYRLD
jgi:ligand-binding sensor domain-containing protein